jgi:hypothetical protein
VNGSDQKGAPVRHTHFAAVISCSRHRQMAPADGIDAEREQHN